MPAMVVGPVVVELPDMAIWRHCPVGLCGHRLGDCLKLYAQAKASQDFQSFVPKAQSLSGTVSFLMSTSLSLRKTCAMRLRQCM